MSILNKVKQMRELNRLKKAAQQSPSPATLGTLAERYIAFGRTEDAYATAQRGLAMFPTSERLSAISTFAKKQRLQAQLTRLRRDIAERPNPTVYTQLASIYRELGNFDKALEICEQCLERFPLNENPYLIIGEVRLARFFQDLIAHDGLEAMKQLRRVSKLNSQNVKAPLLLARLYWAVGALNPMMEELRKVLALAPNHREISRFLREVEANPPDRPRLLDPEDEDIGELPVSELIREVEARGSLANPLEQFPLRDETAPPAVPRGGTHIDEERLRRALVELGKRPEVRNAVIVDRDGEPFAEYADMESLTRKQFAGLVTEVMRTAEETTRRMDMGSFYWCTVEGDFGGISLSRIRTAALAIKYDSLKPREAHGLLEEFAARNLSPVQEVAGA